MPRHSLPQSAYRWALRHLKLEGDTDLFPIPFEIEALRFNWNDLRVDLGNLDLTTHDWKLGRRFTVPKGRLAFRSVTQLDPIDSLVLVAIVKKYGAKIESNRIPKSREIVFSYRFDPQDDGRLYGKKSLWHDYWRASKKNATREDCGWVVRADITDYYNQIYHHVLGNQLRSAGWPEWLARVIEKNFLGQLTHTVSRGIPVGPHAVHLLAECAMIPIDEALLARGLTFCRYVDDFHFFCNTKEDAYTALHVFANVLDVQQQLTVQNQKTRLNAADEFIAYCDSMLEERPINEQEQELLDTIEERDLGPYDFVSLEELQEDAAEATSPERLSTLIDTYLHPQGELLEEVAQPGTNSPDFSRLGWLLRRLWQLGAPGAIDYLLDNIDEVLPVLGDATRYIARAAENYEGDKRESGARILRALDNPVIASSEYVRMVLVHLFTVVPDFNHVDNLTARYPAAPQSVKREIVLAGRTADRGNWARERKDEFHKGDPWLRRATLAAASTFPGDEAEHWVRQIRGHLEPLDKIVLRWAFNDRTFKVGHFRIP